MYSVTGNYDLVAIVRVRTYDDLSELVTSNLAKLEGIEKNRHDAGVQSIFKA